MKDDIYITDKNFMSILDEFELLKKKMDYKTIRLVKRGIHLFIIQYDRNLFINNLYIDRQNDIDIVIRVYDNIVNWRNQQIEKIVL